MRQKSKIIFIIGLGVFLFGISCKKKDYAKELDDYFAKKAPQRAVENKQIDKPNDNLQELLKSCDSGKMDACNMIGYTYYEGKQVEKDLNKAKIFWEKSCNRNDGEGCAALTAFAENKHDALILFKKSCDFGYKFSCDHISNFKDKISEREIGSLLNLTKINPEIDLSWRILKISGVIENTGDNEIIDATIVCELLAESGTKLGDDKVVIYQKFPPHQKKMFANIKMPMVPAQSHHANCFIEKAKFSTSN